MTREETITEEKGLIIPLPTTALEVFKDGGLDPILTAIESEVKKHVPDLTTTKGRDAIKSLAFKVAKSKTYLDGLGKDLVSEWKQKSASVDAERKRMRDKLDALKDEARSPLTMWEEAEEKRIADIRRQINIFNQAPSVEFQSSNEMQMVLETINGLDIVDSFAEFKGEAQMAKDVAIKTLELMFEKQIKAEADQAELDRLRKEEADRKAKEDQERLEREAKERDEKIRKDAADKAQREAAESARQAIEEAERKERAARESADRAEREKIEAARKAKEDQERAVKAAEDRAKVEADRIERERLAKEEDARKEAARIAAEEKAQAEDVEHRRTINQGAMTALVAAGLSGPQAKKVVTSIASGMVPNVTIKY
jgi:hypothetical protein